MADKRISDCDVLELGENIRAIRRKKKMTQKELGEAAFMSDKALSRIEKGNIIPGVDKIFDIADGLGVTPMDLSPKRYKEQAYACIAVLSAGLAFWDGICQRRGRENECDSLCEM